MNGTQAAAAYAALYAPSAETLRNALPDIAEGLHAQLLELHARPSADAAERVAANLDAARRECMRYCEAMRREGSHA